MNTEDYNNKIQQLLEDNITYKEIQRNPTTILERKLREFLSKLK